MSNVKERVSVSEIVRTLQNRHYTAKAIAKVTGLPLKQIKQAMSDETPSVFPEGFKKS